MSSLGRDPFDDIPILADLRERLEHHWHSQPAASAPRETRASRRRHASVLVPVLAAVLVPVVIAVGALALLGHRGAAHHRAAPGPHSAARRPGPVPSGHGGPTPAQTRAIDRAQQAVIKRDPACATHANRGVTFSHATPSQAMLSLLGALRRPAPAPDASLRRLYEAGFDAGAGVYVNYIRRARTEYGKSYYIVPEGHVTPFSPIPTRCYAEFVHTLKRSLRHATAKERAATLQFQQDQLQAQRAESTHREGICFAVVSLHLPWPKPGQPARGVDMGCGQGFSSLTQGLGESIGEGDRSGGNIIAGVVSDGTATVTLAYSAGSGYPARRLTSRVINNVYVIKVPHATAHRDFPTQIIRRDSRGQIIA